MNNDNDIKTAILENHKKWRTPRLIVVTVATIWSFSAQQGVIEIGIAFIAALLCFEFLVVQPHDLYKKIKNWLQNRKAKKRAKDAI